MLLHLTVVKLVFLSVLVMLLLSTCKSTVPFKVTHRGCCKRTSTSQIHTEITNCRMQAARLGCLDAVVFTSRGRLYCCSPDSSWVQVKLQELEKTNMPCKPQKRT